jgi:hypothetical protein
LNLHKKIQESSKIPLLAFSLPFGTPLFNNTSPFGSLGVGELDLFYQDTRIEEVQRLRIC